MRRPRFTFLAGPAGAATLLLATTLVAVPGAAAAGSTVYVSPSGSASGAGTSCDTAAYSTIGDAVAAAAAGSTVVVCAGTYKEDVAIMKALTLAGQGASSTIIDATGMDNGIKIGASNVMVMGFTVENATGEGILAQQPNPVQGPMIQGQQFYTGAPITHVVIKHNVVQNNDQGGLPANAATTTYAECKPSGQIPGDCGEGIHLWSVADSEVLLNTVTGNAGGILLTDEFGPTHNNLIAGNVVTDNAYDCGITIPSHNLGRDPQTGKLMPAFGGVYDNVVRNNVVLDNGLIGQGAGVLIAAPFPGAASYGNVIEDNTIAGNGQSGVTIHSHAPGAWVGDNVIRDNMIGTNNTVGDPDVSPTTDMATTGILVWSAVTPIKVTISGNTIFGNWYGIWLGHVVLAPGARARNTFWAISTYVHAA
jgi:parallel beta-helix repeat protein